MKIVSRFDAASYDVDIRGSRVRICFREGGEDADPVEVDMDSTLASWLIGSLSAVLAALEPDESYEPNDPAAGLPLDPCDCDICAGRTSDER